MDPIHSQPPSTLKWDQMGSAREYSHIWYQIKDFDDNLTYDLIDIMT